MEGSELFQRLTSSEFLFVGGGIAVAITAILSGCLKSVVKSVSRERTRREIAAYIAEGSMTPEQGEKLMGAGERRNGCG
jgi:hypothetical protein